MRLRVESDGDTHPKDVYIVNEEGSRIATMDFVGCGSTERGMHRVARMICAAFNDPIADMPEPKPRRAKQQEPETVHEDGDVFHSPCPKCGSRSTDCGCD